MSSVRYDVQGEAQDAGLSMKRGLGLAAKDRESAHFSVMGCQHKALVEIPAGMASKLSHDRLGFKWVGGEGGFNVQA